MYMCNTYRHTCSTHMYACRHYTYTHMYVCMCVNISFGVENSGISLSLFHPPHSTLRFSSPISFPSHFLFPSPFPFPILPTPLTPRSSLNSLLPSHFKACIWLLPLPFRSFRDSASFDPSYPSLPFLFHPLFSKPPRPSPSQSPLPLLVPPVSPLFYSSLSLFSL